MKVLCKSNCRNKGKDGYCSFSEVRIVDNGQCEGFGKVPEFEPFCDDIVAIYDKAGIPSIMRRFRRMTNKELFGGSDKPHSMFVINGETYDELYISVYPNVIINGKAYSLPMQEPAVNVSQEEAERACFSKGEGWHLLTAAERGFLANLCLKNGTLPHGNTDYGKYHADASETGECFDGCKTLTGSGPATWNHDYTAFGVADLCGNVWERCRGLRLKDGRLQVAQDNDAALDIDLTREGDEWKSMVDDKGEPIRIFVNDGGDIAITSKRESEDDEHGFDGCEWGDVTIDCDTEALKELALYPGEPKAYLYADSTNGEYLPICGGRWGNSSYAGVFHVYLGNLRSLSHHNVGFRSAFYRKLDTDN